MEELLRANLLKLGRLSETAGVSLATVGKRALNDNTFFGRIQSAGASFTVRTYDRLVQWFSDNWPDGADWPEDIERPTPMSSEASAA